MTMTADEVCQMANRVRCERLMACGGPTVEDCLSSFGPCPDNYFSAESNLTVAGLAACIDKLAARTCTDMTVPACLKAGKRPEGVTCAYDSQCHSGACLSGQPCGVCQPGGIAVGAPCDSAGTCEPGAYCTNFVCVDGATVMHAAEGHSCNPGGTPPVVCTGDLFCLPAQSGGGANICTAQPGPGEPCAYSGICRAGAVCTSFTGGGTCIDEATCGTGVACPPNSYCKVGDGGITCAPRAAVGEPCSNRLRGDSLAPCVAPAFCREGNPPGKCVLLRDIGDSCDDNNICTGRVYCVNGKCAAPTSCPIDGGTD
jgi:hypothetical protein